MQSVASGDLPRVMAGLDLAIRAVASVFRGRRAQTPIPTDLQCTPLQPLSQSACAPHAVDGRVEPGHDQYAAMTVRVGVKQ
jgi:hypothetical protein